jgi:hypothetical protein
MGSSSIGHQQQAALSYAGPLQHNRPPATQQAPCNTTGRRQHNRPPATQQAAGNTTGPLQHNRPQATHAAWPAVVTWRTSDAGPVYSQGVGCKAAQAGATRAGGAWGGNRSQAALQSGAIAISGDTTQTPTQRAGSEHGFRVCINSRLATVQALLSRAA